MIVIRSSNISKWVDKLPEYTWANKPAAANFQGRIRVLGVGIDGSSVWYSNGVAWVPNQPIVLYRQLTPVTSGTGTAEEVLGVTGAIPAGVLAAGRQLRIEFGENKSGAAETVTNTLKLGTNADGKTGATSISSTLSLSTTNRMLSCFAVNNVLSATTIQQMQIGGSTQAYGASTSMTGATPRTVPDLTTNAIYLSLTCTKTTGGIETATCPFFDVVLT